jgi:hypothetical protein
MPTTDTKPRRSNPSSREAGYPVDWKRCRVCRSSLRSLSISLGSSFSPDRLRTLATSVPKKVLRHSALTRLRSCLCTRSQNSTWRMSHSCKKKKTPRYAHKCACLPNIKIVCTTAYEKTWTSPFATIPGAQPNMDFTPCCDPMCRRVTRPSQRGTIFPTLVQNHVSPFHIQRSPTLSGPRYDRCMTCAPRRRHGIERGKYRFQMDLKLKSLCQKLIEQKTRPPPSRSWG